MKKRVIFQILLVGLSAWLAYVLYTQIEEPIAFEKTRTERREAVESELMNIKKAQEAYRGITGSFASTFRELVDTLNYGKFPIIQAFEDATNPENIIVTYDTTGYVAAIDSIASLGISLENMGLIPFAEGDSFTLVTDMVEYQQTEIQVVRVETKWKQFMGRFKGKHFKKYNEQYDPEKTLGFGSFTKPILTGSWE